MASPTRSSNHRASLAVLVGVVSVAAVPVGIELTRKLSGARLLDAEWAIPVAFAFGVAALLFVRGAGGEIARRLGRSGGARRIRAARILAVAGICIALSSAIAVGFYEVLVRLER